MALIRGAGRSHDGRIERPRLPRSKSKLTPPGSRTDQREDRREIKQLRFQVNEDQQRLEADVRQFGRRSPQAREDRQRLRRDKHRLRQLQRDRRRDQTI